MEQGRIDEIGQPTMERNRSVAMKDAGRLSGAALKRPQITDALARTFFEEWARVGYSALSLDAVARKAGVGKAALYRRWRSKADMAADLVRSLSAAAIAAADAGDQGSLEADLYAALLAVRRILRHPLVRRILPDLYTAIPREPALAAAMKPGEMAREKKVKARRRPRRTPRRHRPARGHRHADRPALLAHRRAGRALRPSPAEAAGGHDRGRDHRRLSPVSGARAGVARSRRPRRGRC
jgi:AcrR family transcriptional regulator